MTVSYLESAAAAFEPPADDAFQKLGFVPNPGPQARFLALPDDDLDVLYGGAAGGSKSTSLLMYAIRSCVRYPGLQAFWFRRTFPELQQSVLRMLARYGFAKALGARWNKGKFELPVRQRLHPHVRAREERAGSLRAAVRGDPAPAHR